MFTEEGVFDVVRAFRRATVLRGVIDGFRAQLFAAWDQGLTRSRITALKSSIESARREIRDLERSCKKHTGFELLEAEPEADTGT